MDEGLVLNAALGGYAAALAGQRWPRLALRLLGLGLVLHTLSLALRWQSLGHGPFTTLHEILSSNLWSLTLVLALAAWSLQEVRTALRVAAPVLLVLGLWLLASDARPGHFPPTYATPLLYVHTVVGKLYLGLLLVAVALSGVPLLRRLGLALPLRMGTDQRLDQLAYRFAAAAFVFESLMLIVGAAWAQDAWGRYWAWDPLETWAFLSWLALATTLHLRATLRPAPATQGVWLLGCFLLAFLTFFGVPFISTAPHKGAV